jgi:ribosome maturation factor RimP
MKQIATTLHERIAALVTAMGYELVGCEWLNQNRSRILRVYIDQEGGVTVTDCTDVSRQVSAMLDVDEPLLGEYTLEVSSPGVERPLFDAAQYEKQIGRRIKVRARIPGEERRQWVGTLQRVENEKIYLLVDAKEIVVPFSTIEKGNVIAEW